MNRVRANGVQKRTSHGVFLCYRAKDRPFAIDLHERLKFSRVLAWMDEFELEPGQHWRDAIVNALSESQVVVILVGPSGLGDFQKREMNLALQLESKGSLKVIPAILPKVKEADIPPLLLDLHYVDFRRTDIDPFPKLLNGIRRSLKERVQSRGAGATVRS